MSIGRKAVGVAALGAVLAAGLTFALSRPGEAQPSTTRLELMDAAAARARNALGPKVRYLSAAWQNLLSISNRAAQLKAIGLKPSLSAIVGPIGTAKSPTILRDGAVSSPPDLAALGTRFTGFTTSESSTAWCARHAVIAYNDTGSLGETPVGEGASVVGYSQSSDVGVSFTDLGTPPPFSDTSSLLMGDSVAKCSSGSDFYISSLFINSTSTGVSVSISNDKGVTFNPPVVAVSEDASTHIIDKDWMTVVPNVGDIYVTYTDYDYSETVPGCTNTGDVFSSIGFVESTDGGNTWTSPVEVAGACNEVLEGSQVAVGPGEGLVYVTWETISGIGATREIDISKSTDNGVTFSPPVTVSPVQCSGDCFELQGMIRSNEFPSLAINPNNGTLLMTWQDGDNQVPDVLAPFTSGGITADYGFTDIFFSKSKDGGATWSPPVQVNSDPSSDEIDQFEPSIAFSSGTLAICFYDRRNDRLNFKIDRYCAESTDGGSTWTNTQMTTNGFSSVVNQDALIATNYMGDYDAMASDALGLQTGFIDSFATNAPGYPRVRSKKF